MLRHVMTILLLTALGGCMTPAERAEAAKDEVDRMVRVYGPACDKMGFTKDTDPWRECLLRMRAHDDERYRNRPYTTTCFGQRGFYNCTSF
jgi:hypothetical protein